MTNGGPANTGMKWFFSYARADANDLDPGQADVDTFFKDLVLNVRRLAPRSDAFRDVRDIDLGAQWESTILRNLGEASVLVCLLSPSYLESSYCSREWGYFASRTTDGKARIVPVTWVPSESLPPAIAELQFSNERLPPSYMQRGMQELTELRNGRHLDDYVQARAVLAEVIKQALMLPPLPTPSGPPPKFGELRDVFRVRPPVLSLSTDTLQLGQMSHGASALLTVLNKGDGKLEPALSDEDMHVLTLAIEGQLPRAVSEGTLESAYEHRVGGQGPREPKSLLRTTRAGQPAVQHPPATVVSPPGAMDLDLDTTPALTAGTTGSHPVQVAIATRESMLVGPPASPQARLGTRRALLAGLVAAVLFILVGAMVVERRPKPGEVQGGTIAASAPAPESRPAEIVATPQVAPDPANAPHQMAPPQKQQPVAGVSATPAPSTQAPSTQAPSTQAPSTRRSPPPNAISPKKASPGTGKLMLIVMPTWRSVYIDGDLKRVKQNGEDKPSVWHNRGSPAEITLPVGTYSLRLSNDNPREDVVMTVGILSDQVVTIDCDFTRPSDQCVSSAAR